MAITQEDIFKVADELNQEGIRPTLSAVRKKLGSGSFSTISAAMSEWKQKQGTNVNQKPQDPLPPAIIEAMNAHAATVWNVATSLAEKRLDADRTKLDEERCASQEAVAEATELADTLTSENEALQAKLAGYDELRREHDRLKDQLADQKKRSSDELMRVMEKVQRHEAEALEARKEARTAIEEAAALRGQLEAYKEQLAALAPTINPTQRGKAAAKD